MFSSEIDEVLTLEPVTKACYRGVYSCDNMPHLGKKSTFIVVNTAPSYTKCEHWILLFKTGEKLYLYLTVWCTVHLIVENVFMIHWKYYTLVLKLF